MSSMQQWAFLAMQDKEGKLSPDKSSAFQELKNRAGQAGQTLAQYVEPALSVGSGMAGHLAGIAVGAGGIGMGVDAAENAYNRTKDWMTYRPRTESGQAGLEWLGDKSQVVGDAVNKAIGQGAGAVISAIPGQTAEAAPAIQAAITNKGLGKSAEDYITQTTGSPTAGKLASWVPGAVELVAGGKGIMNAAKLEMGDIGGQGMGKQRGIFAGVKAKGADLDAKAKAEEMLAAGADRDQIWKDTGWMKDIDGQWKWEIDDSQMAMQGRDFNKEMREAAKAGDMEAVMRIGNERKSYVQPSEESNILSSVVDHNELFNAYPDAQNVGYQVDKGMQLGEASYNPGSERITMSPMNRDAVRSPVLHETQHWVQGEENFARGGNTGMFDRGDVGVTTPRMLSLRSEVNKILQSDEFISEGMKMRQQGIPSHEIRKTLYDKYDLNQKIDEIYSNEDRMAGLTSFEKYQRLAGEAESRNVETRRDMTAEERRAKAPWETMTDVPESELIVQGQDQVTGIQQSVASGMSMKDANKQLRGFGDGAYVDQTGNGKFAVYDNDGSIGSFDTLEQAVKAKTDKAEGGSYKVQHEAPMLDSYPSASDLNDVFPDVYSGKALQYYGTGVDYDNKAISIIKGMNANPSKAVTVYRAVPKDVTDINPGDWITTTKQYALDHIGDDDGFHIITKKVKPGEMASDGNSIHEFGYDPSANKPTKGRLK